MPYIHRNGAYPKTTYHSERDCRHLKKAGGVREIDETMVERMHLSLCKDCAGETVHQQGDHSMYRMLCKLGEEHE